MNQQNEHLIQPSSPDELTKETREFWRDVGRTLVRESIATLDETAKQIIGVAGILEGLYFHAIAYSDLRGQVTTLLPLAVYLAPIVFLLFSILTAFAIFFPDRYRINIRSFEASRQAYEHVVARKLQLLKAASIFLILGIASTLLALMLYLRG